MGATIWEQAYEILLDFKPTRRKERSRENRAKIMRIGVDKEYAEALIEQIIFVDKAKKRIAMDRDKLAEERMVVMGKLIRYESDSAAARFEYLQKELRVEDRAARERLQNDVIVKLDEISRKQDKICF